jgi:hypothetical protein
MRKVACHAVRSMAMLLVLSCASAHPRVAGHSGFQTCQGKEGQTEASVTCGVGFVPDCGCAADGQAFCHCVAAAR